MPAWAFADLHSGQKFKLLRTHVPSRGQTRHVVPSASSSQTSRTLFCGSRSAVFFTFLCFFLVDLLFQLGPKPSAAVLPGVVSTGGLSRGSQERCSGELHPGAGHRAAALSSTLVNQQHVGNKLPLNRNMYKTGSHVNHLMKTCDQRLVGK